MKTEVIDIVVEVLEVILKKHAVAGRHEINRTDLAAAVADIKAENTALKSAVSEGKTPSVF